MADIQLRSYQQLLGPMIAKLLAETDLNDLNPGSLFLTVLEAAASSDFTQEGKILNLLRLRDVDKAKGVDLERLAEESGVSPSRLGAESSSVTVKISDSSFTKISTAIFAGAVSPASGDTSLKVVDASAFPSSGTIYIGRGTSTSEAISYASKSNLGQYWTLTLASALSKDHLVNEEIVVAQGGDRPISAGTIVRVPAGAGNPAIEFRITANVTLPDGEDSLSDIEAVATTPGSASNVGAGKIDDFSTFPFTTAVVTNEVPAEDGRDAETDTELRQRIKDHVHNLGRGTQRSIIQAARLVKDSEEDKRVVSAFIREPVTTGALGFLFIDDGTGYKPPFSGVGEEEIVTSAAGTEQFFQLQQFPLVRAQLSSIGLEPFALSGGERLSVDVDGEIEERSIPNTGYRAPGVVTAQEIAEAINLNFTSIEARAKDGRLFISPTADSPDYIRVGVATTSDANSVIRFPTRRQYTIRLYKNEKLLEKNGFEAKVQTFPNTQWPVFSSSETLQFKIDGIDSPLVTITNADFSALTSSNTINGASGADWVVVLNSKFIGVTAKTRDDGTFIVVSNRGASDAAKVAVIGGSLNGTLFPADTASEGRGPEFKLNPLLGQIETIERLAEGDELKAGTVNTAAFVDTLAQDVFDLSLTLGSKAELVVVPDSEIEILTFAQTLGALTYSNSTPGIQRITGAVAQFSEVTKDDWCHQYNLPRNGVFKVFDVAANGSYVDLYDPSPTTSSDTPNGTTKTMTFWRGKGLPQVVRFTSGASVFNTTIQTDFNTQISGADAELLDSGIVRFQTERLEGTGGLGIPAVSGTASNLGIVAGNYPSNDPHIAAIESDDLFGLPSQRIVVAIADASDPYNDLQVSGTPFTEASHNRPVMSYLGHHAKLPRQPLERLTSSRLTLRDISPFQVNGLGFDMKAVTGAGAEFGENDNMVFIMDNDPAKKTFDIPMYVEGTVSGPSLPNSLNFDAEDGAGDLFGSSTRWLGHRFDDYRAWFQAKGLTPFSTANTQIRVRAVQFGPNGTNIQFGIFDPQNPNTTASASFTLDALNNEILISAFLGSGNERSIGMTPNARVEIAYTGPVSGIYTYKAQFLPPVDLTTVLVGDVLSLPDPNFSNANRGTLKVTAISNLKDTSRSYEHIQDPVSNSTVTGSNSIAIGSVPAANIEVGDKIRVDSITQLATAPSTSSTVTVAGSGAYTSTGSFVANATTFNYTGYAAGVFTGVTPDPSTLVNVGDAVVQTILIPYSLNILTSAFPNITVDGIGFIDGDGYDFTIIHKALTADLAPSFTVAIGDLIQVSSQVLVVTSVLSPTTFHVSTPFTFTGLQSGTVSRLILTGERTSAGTNEIISTSSMQGVRVFPLAATTASALITAVNNTAGVKDLVFLSNAPGHNGGGQITTTTEIELATGDTRFQLENGERFVYHCVNASPAFQLKSALDTPPEVGDKIRFLPMTPQNIRDHFNRKQISGLSIAANVDLVNGARRVQVASKVPGANGQVFAVGGKASGNNSLAIRSSSQELSNSVGVIQVDRSSLSLLAPGQTIKVKQTGRAKKAFVGSTPISSTSAEIQIVTPGVGRLLFGVALAAIRSYTHSGTVVWVVRKLSRTRVRYEKISGTSVLPGALVADDWVLVGNGTTYAGSTPAQVFASANQGYFQVRETDNSTYFDIDNEDAAEEFISTAAAPYLFMPYSSVIPGDQISIGADSPFSTANKGVYTISNVNTLSQVDFANANVANEGPFTLGSQGVDSIRVQDQGFVTYRKVTSISPNPSDPTAIGEVVVTPGYNISIVNEDQGAKISFPNRLGFSADPIPGISGYQYWTGLKRAVQRTIDGFASNTTDFEGVRAAGVSIEVREPQIQRVTLNVKVKTKEGVALPSITDPIKSNVVGFINSLGLGQDVVLSEVVSIIQSTAGVDSVVLVDPLLQEERITVSDKAVPRTTPAEIFVS